MTTPFSFHCMICFEEFDPDGRYPVVLPCGHTYVCHICANRLDKCMECRIPLYDLLPAHHPHHNPALGGGPPHHRSAWTSARSGPPPARRTMNISGSHMSPSPPLPQPPMKRRLALPKNVVLLSLIEATELASADARHKYAESPRSTAAAPSSSSTAMTMTTTQQQQHHTTNGSPSFDELTAAGGGGGQHDLHSMGSMLDRDDDDTEGEEEADDDAVVDQDQKEEEKIKMSTSLAVGVAGTYAVAVKEGLDIFPNRPHLTTRSMDASSSNNGQDDVESLVRVYQVDQHSKDYEDHHSTQPTTTSTTTPCKRKDPLKLCYGDRVQVVALGGGWARLSRGYGFVRADENQLVKVRGPLDRSCKLEAMLCSLSDRRKELRYEQSKIDNQFIRLMNELQHSLQNDEDLTVIPADTFCVPQMEYIPDPPNGEAHKEEKSSSPTDLAYYPQKPEPERPSTPPMDENRRVGGGFGCFAFGDNTEPVGTPSQMLRSALSNTEMRGLFPNANQHPSPSAMRAGAQAWREQQGRTAAINFRTGMSGHMGILSTQSHAHDVYLGGRNYSDHGRGAGVAPSGSTRQAMSSHTGLSMTKGLSTFQGIFNSLTLPLIGTPPRPDDREAHLPRTGSM